MKRLLLAALMLVWPAAAQPAPRPDTRPNILILFNDDHRADAIGALGTPILKTPNLDRLAAGGLVFRHAYMQGAFTGATCVPSRAMLISGQSLFHVDNLLERDPSWPAAFAGAGYRTFITGKWHNEERSVAHCFQRGRAVFVGGMSRNPMRDNVQDLRDGRLTPPRPAGQHLCAAFADEAIRFLQEPQSGPFFCYVAFDGPHDPHIVPDDYPVHYRPEDIPLPPNFAPRHPFDNGELQVRDEQLLPHPRPPAQVRQMLADYYRYISYLDQQTGRILDALRQSPYGSNTIVVFSADSGAARGSHGLLGKQSLYDHSIRVPLILSGPGIGAGQSTAADCYLYDLLPTLGARCGIPPPFGSEGIDFGAALRDPAAPGRSEMIFAYRDVQRAIQQGPWKLIHYPRVGRTQLFKLDDDPYEMKDLAGDPAQTERIITLMQRLREQAKQSGDTLTF